MNRVIIDANVLVALIDEIDKWHSTSLKISKKLTAKGWEIIYLDCVVNETTSVLGKRLEEKKRSTEFTKHIKRLNNQVPKGKIEWVYPKVPDLYNNILKLMVQSDGRLNFHDALMALIMREYGVEYFVSFDEDFDSINWIKRIKDETEIV